MYILNLIKSKGWGGEQRDGPEERKNSSSYAHSGILQPVLSTHPKNKDQDRISASKKKS